MGTKLIWEIGGQYCIVSQRNARDPREMNFDKWSLEKLGFHCTTGLVVITELCRLPREAHTHRNHAFIFLWSSLSAACGLWVPTYGEDDGVAQHGAHSGQPMHACAAYTSALWYSQSIFMVNWQLSKQGICWPVSHDRIAGSSLELIEVAFFLKLTTD